MSSQHSDLFHPPSGAMAPRCAQHPIIATLLTHDAACPECLRTDNPHTGFTTVMSPIIDPYTEHIDYVVHYLVMLDRGGLVRDVGDDGSSRASTSSSPSASSVFTSSPKSTHIVQTPAVPQPSQFEETLEIPDSTSSTTTTPKRNHQADDDDKVECSKASIAYGSFFTDNTFGPNRPATPYPQDYLTSPCEDDADAITDQLGDTHLIGSSVRSHSPSPASTPLARSTLPAPGGLLSISQRLAASPLSLPTRSLSPSTVNVPCIADQLGGTRYTPATRSPSPSLDGVIYITDRLASQALYSKVLPMSPSSLLDGHLWARTRLAIPHVRVPSVRYPPLGSEFTPSEYRQSQPSSLDAVSLLVMPICHPAIGNLSSSSEGHVVDTNAITPLAMPHARVPLARYPNRDNEGYHSIYRRRPSSPHAVALLDMPSRPPVIDNLSFITQSRDEVGNLHVGDSSHGSYSSLPVEINTPLKSPNYPIIEPPQSPRLRATVNREPSHLDIDDKLPVITQDDVEAQCQPTAVSSRVGPSTTSTRSESPYGFPETPCVEPPNIDPDYIETNQQVYLRLHGKIHTEYMHVTRRVLPDLWRRVNYPQHPMMKTAMEREIAELMFSSDEQRQEMARLEISTKGVGQGITVEMFQAMRRGCDKEREVEGESDDGEGSGQESVDDSERDCGGACECSGAIDDGDGQEGEAPRRWSWS